MTLGVMQNAAHGVKHGYYNRLHGVFSLFFQNSDTRALAAARADKIKELEEEDSPRQPEAAKTVLSDEPDWKREMREKKEKARARKKTAESGGDVTGDGKTAPEAAPPDKVARGTDEYPDDGPGMRLKEPDWKREMREKKEARRREKEAAGSAQ